MQLPKSILIIEDEIITQRYIKDILKQYKVEHTECCDNAKTAMELIRSNEVSYDMILMDINIKGSTDGIQLAREILRREEIPIVFITAHSDQETFEEVLELTPYGFIAKPFSARDIALSIQLAYQRFLAEEEHNKADNIQSGDEKIFLSSEYSYAISRQELYKNDHPVKLNKKQKKLVDILCQNINHSVDYHTLVLEIWDGEDVADSALRTLVYSLRKQYPDLPIESHSKVGYAMIQINND